VTVDNFEPIEFDNKTNLVIDAGAGSDTINLNNPNTPSGLTGITVNAGDPTADSDTVVVNGTTSLDTITVDMLSIDGARVTGAQPVTVTVTTAEHLTINGRGGADALTYTSPGSGAEITFTPGANPDAGGITAQRFTGTPLLPVAFEALRDTGSLTFANAGGTRTDGLDIIGTDNDDQFSLNAAGTVQIVKPAFAPRVTLPISTPGVTFLRLIGRDGDDTFNIAAGYQIGTGVEIQGGNPGSGSDVLNLTGAASAIESVRITPDLTKSDDQDITGLGGPIDASGIELITYTGTGTDDTLTIDPGVGDNTMRVDRGVGADRVTSDSLPQIEFSGLLQFMADVDSPVGADGADVVTFATWSLTGTAVDLYNVIGGAADTLVIEGVDGTADQFDVFNPTTLDGTIATLGAITGGAGYTPGTYYNVPLTGGTGGLASANVVVGAGGAVTAVTLVTGGLGYTAGDALSAADANLGGGGGAGFSIPVATVSNTDPSLAVLDANSLVAVMETSGALGRLQVNTLSGDDRLSLDNDAAAWDGLVTLPSGIHFDGGQGRDTLALEASAGLLTGTTYNVGPTVDAGNVLQTSAAGTQTVYFTGLEPTVMEGTGPLVVNATNADNAIAYTRGPGVDALFTNGGAADDTTGLVSIDGLETNEFTGFTTLTINARGGSDAISLRNTIAPSSVTLGSTLGDGVAMGSPVITVTGGDPTASSDTVVVNGLPLAAITGLGAITGGAAYVDGTYTGVPLTGGTGAGATANIVVTAGAVTEVTLIDPGAGYTAADALSASAANLGGAGAGFSIPVTTVSAADVIGVTPTAADAASLTGVQGVAQVDVSTTESLLINGQGGSDVLTVNGTANADQFTHTPGGARDAGSVTVDNATETLLGLDYVNLGLGGSVQFDGLGLTDFLVARGTDSSEYIGVSFAAANNINVWVSTALGFHVPVQTINGTVENFHVESLEGDDIIDVLSPVNTSGFFFGVFGGGPGLGSDSLRLFGAASAIDNVRIAPLAGLSDEQSITGLGAPINVSGIELIRYLGAGTDDTLTVDPGAGDNAMRVEAGVGAFDRVISDSLPQIEFSGLSQFVADVDPAGANGTDVVTFATWFLAGATPANYNMIGGATDTLVIEGVDGTADDFTVTNPLVLNGTITALGAITAGAGYTPGTYINVPLTLGSGSGASANIVVGAGGTVTGVTLASGGLNYTAGDVLSAADANLGGGGGAGFSIPATTVSSTNPSVAVTDGSGTAATVTETSGALGRLQVDTLGGDDRLYVFNDVSGAPGPTDGLVTLPSGIEYNAGQGRDTLALFASAGLLTGTTYNVGPTADAGNVVQTSAAGTQTIYFTGLEPTVMEGTGPLVVNATDVANGINYTQGPATDPLFTDGALPDDTTGLVSIDDFEMDEFTGFGTLTINSLAGNDTVYLNNPIAPTSDTLGTYLGSDATGVALPAGTPLITVNGGLGDDVVDGSLTPAVTLLALNGNGGDDLLTGGLGDDVLRGGLGNDTLVNSRGDDTYDGADAPAGVADTITQTSGFDTVVIPGTPGNDMIDVFQPAPSGVVDDGYRLQTNTVGTDAIVQATLGVAPTDPATRPTVEEVRIEAGAGNDLIRVGHADEYANGGAPTDGEPTQMMRFNVIGDAPNASDRLVVQDDGDGDLVLVRQAPDERSGRVTIGPAVNTTTAAGYYGDIVYSGIERIDITPSNEIPLSDAALSDFILSRGTGTDGEGRIVVFEQDPFELNDIRTIATDTGDVFRIDRNPNIDPGAVTGIIATLGAITGGAGYTPGTYINVPLTGGTGAGVIADIVVNAGGAVASVTLVNAGLGYTAADALSAADANLGGGGGAGFSIPVATLASWSVPGDEDWYEYRATATGTFTFNVLFHEVGTLGNGRAGLPGDGDLDAQLYNANGALIATSATADDNESITITVHEGNSYFLRVLGTQANLANTSSSTAINLYDLQIVNADELGPQVFDPDGTGPDQAIQINGTPTYDLFANKQSLANSAVAAAPAPTTTVFAGGAALSPVSNYYVGRSLRFTSGAAALVGQSRAITAYDGATNVFTVGTPFPVVPVAGNTFEIVTLGPTPLVNGLTINFHDLPDPRSPGNVYEALNLTTASSPGNYSVVGDANGTIPIASVTAINDALTGAVIGIPAPMAVLFSATNTPANIAAATPTAMTRLNLTAGFYNGATMRFTTGALAGQTRPIINYTVPGGVPTFSFAGVPFPAAPAATDLFEILSPVTAQVILDFNEPLPDDRFTLTVNDSVRDPANNRLDGESDAPEPNAGPTFPSGDSIAGGDFMARFTVDSRPELGVAHAGSVWVDTNGNFSFDPDNVDFTNRDITYVMAVTTDDVFAGNFAGPGPDGAFGTADDLPTDGFDKLAAYGRIGSNFRWLIDFDNDGVPEDIDGDGVVGHVDPLGINGLPVAGNFDNIAGNGDEVGLLAGNTWYFDGDHTYTMGTPGDIVFNGPLTGLPIVGDFNNDGWEDLGTWKEDAFSFLLATAPNTWPGLPQTLQFGFIGVREMPVAADMDQDGIDDIGLWVPDRAGVNPEAGGEWYFLVSAGETIPQRILNENGVAQFEPVPFGSDMHAMFGDEFGAPVVGNFDPPVTPVNAGAWSIGNTNPDNAYDVNGDGLVTPLDVLILIGQINSGHGGQLGSLSSSAGPYLDVNKDGALSSLDVLTEVTVINAQNANGGEGEGAAVVDEVVAEAEPIDQLFTIEIASSPIDISIETGAAGTGTNNVDRYFATDETVLARDATLLDDEIVGAMFDSRTENEEDSQSVLVAAVLDLEAVLSEIAVDVSLAAVGNDQ